jgi:hypothetical protein
MGAGAIYIPNDATMPCPVGTQILVVCGTSSAITFAPNSGVTLLSKDSKRTIDGLYAAVTLVKLSANEWFLIGALKV